jgi:periplasmic copper chaperone A
MSQLRKALLALSIIGTFFGATAGTASAQTYTVGSLKIEQPWARATPGGAKVGGGYLTITNTGTTPDRLLGGSLPQAGRFEVHEMKMVGGMMQMREVKGGLEIRPGQKVELKPGGYHIMFMNLHAPFKQGDKLKGQLRFEKAGTVNVEFKVEGIGASGPMPMQMPMHGH